MVLKVNFAPFYWDSAVIALWAVILRSWGCEGCVTNVTHMKWRKAFLVGPSVRPPLITMSTRLMTISLVGMAKKWNSGYHSLHFLLIFPLIVDRKSEKKFLISLIKLLFRADILSNKTNASRNGAGTFTPFTFPPFCSELYGFFIRLLNLMMG